MEKRNNKLIIVMSFAKDEISHSLLNFILSLLSLSMYYVQINSYLFICWLTIFIVLFKLLLHFKNAGNSNVTSVKYSEIII